MLQLDSKITLDAAAIKAANLTDRFTESELQRIGDECSRGLESDERSRDRWLQRNEAGMDLALLLSKDKTFPWPGCANVSFPLVAIAAQQFHARAYPALVPADQVVKCEVFGPDPEGQLTERATRIESHMSWQLLQEDSCWEDQEDKALLNLAIVGTNFKKTYFDSHHNVSELVLAKNLVMDYWAKSVETCGRKTEYIQTSRNEIYARVISEAYRDCLDSAWYRGTPAPQTTEAQRREDQRQGTSQPAAGDSETPFILCEQHVNLDLDQDGYAEPYIITFEKQSHYVLRIVTRFESEKAISRAKSGKFAGKIVSITSTEHYTKKTFIPSPDGGIYDLGFGVFLGPLNEATNSLVNMLLDAGTMQTTAGGFLGRGAKIRGGTYTVAPFEWKRVDSTGDDLRKSILPLPVNAPSDVLFQLLSLLINYASRVAGTTDITVGENPGQNTPAQTTQTMVEMGQKIYTAIFKRCWRASKEEFQKLFRLNSVYLVVGKVYPGGATIEDYQEGSELIAPVADPTITSDSMRLQLAITMKQAAATTPGYNRDLVEKNFLRALRVRNVDAVFPGTQGLPPPEDPKVTLQNIKESGATQRLQMELQAKAQELVAQLLEEQRLNNAKISDLMASAAEHAANAQSEEAYAQVAAINAQLTLAEQENESLMSRIEVALRAAEIRSRHAIGMKQAEKKASSE